MAMVAVILIPFALFNIVGIVFGYHAIVALKANHFPPFQGEGVLFGCCFSFSAPPRIAAFWDLAAGRVVIWGSCAVVPMLTAIMSAKSFVSLALATILVWTVFTGVSGFWFWMFALFNGGV